MMYRRQWSLIGLCTALLYFSVRRGGEYGLTPSGRSVEASSSGRMLLEHQLEAMVAVESGKETW